jgi:hypothetical protein
MVVVTAGLLAVALLKALAVGNAIRWLDRRGPAFRAALAAGRPDTVIAQEHAYDRLGGAFFPFGVKDYRLRRLIRVVGAGHPVRTGPLIVLRHLLFNLAALVPVCTAYLIWLATTDAVPDLVPRRAHDAVALALAGTLLAVTILLAIEAVYAYAVLGSYGIGFHELRPERRRPERALVREFQVFAGTLITAFVAGVGATYVVALRFGGYGRIPTRPDEPGAIPGQVLDCAYYALLAFSGAGDPEPLAPAGKVVTGLVAAQGLALLLLVLASMLAIADRGGAPGVGPASPGPAPPPGASPRVPAALLEPPVAPPGPVPDPTAGRRVVEFAAAVVVAGAVGAAVALAMDRAGHRRTRRVSARPGPGTPGRGW